MKAATHVLAIVCTAVLILLPIARKLPAFGRKCAVKELINTRSIVEKRIEDMSRDLVKRLSALGTVISKDRDFSMKVLVENDLSASEVTEIAAAHMGPMALSVLDVTDESYTVLSSGHFAARAGVSAAKKAEILSENALFITDNIKGSERLTLQAKVGFRCAGIPFYCIGGMEIDTSFLSLCSPRDEVRLLLKRGSDIIGIDSIETMSEIKDNTLILNDSTYLAAPVSLSTAERDIVTTEIIIIMPLPEKATLLSLF
jgi:hypothetical protein